MIDSDVILESGVTIFDENLVNLFGCSIGTGSFVGPFVEITRGVLVGRNCKIESHSFLCDGVTVENDVFIGHGVIFTNDSYPTTRRQVARFKTTVRQGVSLGSNATIVAPVEIGRGSVVGAGAVVTRDVPAFSIVAGNPAKVVRNFASQDEINAYIESRQRSVE